VNFNRYFVGEHEKTNIICEIICSDNVNFSYLQWKYAFNTRTEALSIGAAESVSCGSSSLSSMKQYNTCHLNETSRPSAEIEQKYKHMRPRKVRQILNKVDLSCGSSTVTTLSHRCEVYKLSSSENENT